MTSVPPCWPCSPSSRGTATRIIQEVAERSGGEAGALWEQLGQLHAAAQQVMGAGTPAQITAATAALTEARKTIYRLLAE